MALPKFIITMDGYFRLGMVNQHKDLLKPEDQCIVPSVYRGLRLVYTYDDNFHDNIDISEELKIEYYD